MNASDKAVVRKLVEGVAMSRSLVIRGRIAWAWKRLSLLQRENVRDATRAEYLNDEVLGRVLDAKNAATNARKRRP